MSAMAEETVKEMKKPEEPPVNQQVKTDLAILSKKFLNKIGHTQRIAHIYDRCFRINYYNTEKGNEIDESYFVTVNGDSVQVEWDELLPNKIWKHNIGIR